jgi:hypothetical protein
MVFNEHRELLRDVCKLANAMKRQGVKKGDNVRDPFLLSYPFLSNHFLLFSLSFLLFSLVIFSCPLSSFSLFSSPLPSPNLFSSVVLTY